MHNQINNIIQFITKQLYQFYPVIVFSIPFVLFGLLFAKKLVFTLALEKLFPQSDISESQLKELGYYILKLMKEKNQKESLQDIVGIYKNHIRFCSLEECSCDKLYFNEREEYMELVPDNKSFPTKNMFFSLREAPPQMLDNLTEIEFTNKLIEILLLTLRKIKNSNLFVSSQFMQTYICFYNLKNLYRAFHTLILIRQEDLSFAHQFQQFSIKRRIERAMIDHEKRNSFSTKINLTTIKLGVISSIV